MRYVSTRGAAPVLAFDDVMLTGLARDGGLYVPDSWPHFGPAELRAMRGEGYADLAATVMRPFVHDSALAPEFDGVIRQAYARFDHHVVTPLKEIDRRLWLMELFHGPTLAFKDIAMQLLGLMFDALLTRRGQRATVLGATSGDTGSAAIEACRGRPALDTFILFPHGRVSEVQRRQMTTVHDPNVHALAIDGTFDDCQDLVKACFNDLAFRDAIGLTAVNSINWARIMPQIVYYFHAALALGAPERPVSFAVPTGNFGNIYAGYAARQMGLPIERLLVGSNVNDILFRFFGSGEMSIDEVVPTLSPSMDIQVSSNLERLLFDVFGRDGATLDAAMTGFRETGHLRIDRERLAGTASVFSAARVDDDETRSVIETVHRTSGEVIDPHTAVGVGAAGKLDDGSSVPVVALACAHPAKFPDAVRDAAGHAPALPDRLADLYERPERGTVLANDLAAVQDYLSERTGRAPGARDDQGATA